MANPYSLDVPDIFYRPQVQPRFAGAIDAFMGQRDEEEKRQRLIEEQRRKAEEISYKRQQDQLANDRQGRLDQQNVDQTRGKSLMEILNAAHAGDRDTVQAMSAQKGFNYDPGASSNLPDRAPQLQMPGSEVPTRLPGLNMRLQAPEGVDQAETPDLPGFTKTFPGRVPAAPNMAGLADTPDELQFGRAPSLKVGQQDVPLDIGSDDRQADSANERMIRRQSADDERTALRQQTSQQRSFEQRDKELNTRKVNTDEQIRLRAELRPKKGAKGGAGGSGATDESTIVDWDTGKAIAKAPVTKSGASIPGRQVAKMLGDGKALESQLRKIQEKTVELDSLDRAPVIGGFRARPQLIDDMANDLLDPLSQFLGGGVAKEAEAKRRLNQLKASLKKDPATAKESIDNTIAYMRERYQQIATAAAHGTAPAAAGGKGGDGADPARIKTLAAKARREGNEEAARELEAMLK